MVFNFLFSFILFLLPHWNFLHGCYNIVLPLMPFSTNYPLVSNLVLYGQCIFMFFQILWGLLHTKLFLNANTIQGKTA